MPVLVLRQRRQWQGGDASSLEGAFACRNPRSAILALAVHNTPHGSSAKAKIAFASEAPGRESEIATFNINTIATFNINNVNKRLANPLDWRRTARPDVARLQELKSQRFGISGSSPSGRPVTARFGAGKSHGTASPDLHAMASPSSRTPVSRLVM